MLRIYTPYILSIYLFPIPYSLLPASARCVIAAVGHDVVVVRVVVKKDAVLAVRVSGCYQRVCCRSNYAGRCRPSCSFQQD